MLLKLLFMTVLFYSILIVVFGQNKNGNCKASPGYMSDCTEYITSNCKNATFTANRRAYNASCSEVSLFWSYPMYNLTILFQNDVGKSYSLCIVPVGCTQSYRTLANGKEVPIKWNTQSTQPVCFKSESKSQSIMKFRFDGGDKLFCYGTYIRFCYRY